MKNSGWLTALGRNLKERARFVVRASSAEDGELGLALPLGVKLAGLVHK
jgi:hypothetical protein